jgi:protein-S-isoprenylcysteine O-methyltransferase Ste14
VPIPFLAAILWWFFLVSWWLAALWVAKAARTAPLGRRLGYFAGFAIGFCALFATNRLSAHPHRLWSAPDGVRSLLVVGEIGAFAFAWWARLHLGRLWSGMLTLREGHRVVDTGPYALVRHPIYTAFIAASWCYALIEARAIPLAGAVILTVVMAVKASEEEDFLRRELGADDYDAYSARVPMLIPLPRRRA